MPDGLDSRQRVRRDPLSANETDLLLLLAEGLTNREIAVRLGVTVPTARWRIRRVYVKLGVRNRIEAIGSVIGTHSAPLHAVAVRTLGLIPEPPKVQLEILRLLGRGMKRKEIANSLSLPLASVKWYMHRIYCKLNARNRVEALARAHHLNWL
jgi:DNA-binding NarL/FixJ family response regulator